MNQNRKDFDQNKSPRNSLREQIYRNGLEAPGIQTKTALDEKENYILLEIMNKAVDPQLPRGERWIMGHKFFFEDLRMGDRSYLSFENGHSGVHAVFACLFCFLRFGLHGLCCKAPELEGPEARLRDNEHYGRMALIAHRFHEFEARCTRGPRSRA